MFFKELLSQTVAIFGLLQYPLRLYPQSQTPQPQSSPSGPLDYLSSFSQLTISLPHVNPTKSFWTHGSPDANPLAKEGSQGPLTTDTDIAIIGSGITGIGTAYHLSELVESQDISLSIVVLEARDFCSGATGRNGGHLTPNVFQGFEMNAERYGVEDAVKSLALENHTANSIVSILESSGTSDDVDLVECLHLDLFFSEREENKSKTDWAAALRAGVNLDQVRFLSKEETQQIYGPAYPSVRFTGHNLWPLKAVTKFFRIAQDKLAVLKNESKLQIHTQTPVTEITHIEKLFMSNSTLPRRWLLQTPRGSIRANTVIHATNGYAAHLLPFLSAAPGGGIVPTRGQVIATRAQVGTEKLLTPSYSGNDGHEYWFPRPANKTESDVSNQKPLVILGGGRETAGPDQEFGVTDDSVINPRVSKTLREFLPSVYPSGWFPRDTIPEMEWTGIMGYTESTDPLVGPISDFLENVALEGQYIAAGYTGHGMPRAFGCAEALAQLIVADIKNETWIVPDWLPNHFLTNFKSQP